MKSNYYFENGKFVLNNFSNCPPFTNFLPGIAGLSGRPIWAFYVNRGQGIAGFGVGGKDLPIAEFSPAEIAYANVPRQGFRTFLLIDGKPHEPFGVGTTAPTRMETYRHGFAIEQNSANFRYRVEYFGVPNRNFAALGRIVYYTNTTHFLQSVEVLDGLAQIMPYGLSNSAFKETGNLFKSWMVAEGMNEGYSFVRMRSSTADTAEVSDVTGGNFFLPVGEYDVVVDSNLVFGQDFTKTTPTVFNRKGIDSKALQNQRDENQLFCSFAHHKRTVNPGQTVMLCELIGYADNREFVRELKSTFTQQDVVNMQKEAAAEANKIALLVDTHTAHPLFDEYVKQSYFDNVLRGGMPVTVGGKPYYVFSRKHGDPERDYNFFQLEPKPYSSGNGNFRDVAQNRRNDVFITPQCGDFNVKYFFSLLQADGYNPLSVLGVRYACEQGKFTLGDAVLKLGLDEQSLDEFVRNCEPVYEASFSEGYWTDHFVYLIDLLTAYLGVYPDKKEEIMYHAPLKWFSSGVQILPRSKQSVLTKNGVRRLHSIVKCGKDGWLNVGDKHYETTLATKLLFLVLIKLATLDPLGCGVDMEGGKPGWCDATNGLPALFGSNVADTVELLRLVQTLKELDLGEHSISWAREQNDLFKNVLGLLSDDVDEQQFYEKTHTAKEQYLSCAYGGFSGAVAEVSGGTIRKFLTKAEKRLRQGLARAKELGDGWLPTYLTYEVTSYDELEGGLVLPKTFKVRALPHFTEAVAKSLTVGQRDVYKIAKRSSLYDKKLKLFVTSEPLENETPEIGRIRSFPVGWLEREACFLHMQYKLLLSLLKVGMYNEFYSEIQHGLVPFMPPERYGRSTIENSSFIVSSAHSDSAKWGKGYQARLTGANAEVLSMWRLMMGCEQPFTVADGKLKFQLSPKLHQSFFDNGRISFTLFGKIKVTYVNDTGANSWNTQVASYTLHGAQTLQTQTIEGALAEDVRDGKYTEIEVILK